ncbi:hypothetical protein B0H66DRAFT_182264 [Apodospora peruviana]|uniref:Zinc finger protein n=1 Tax=Apodospora peruviana TaxID=516989 RepID=A0AAE0IBD6_9PEZI|nr:hypothetical protein B0H66DRAFT_182264 [Apodospora peruviana]
MILEGACFVAPQPDRGFELESVIPCVFQRLPHHHIVPHQSDSLGISRSVHSVTCVQPSATMGGKKRKHPDLEELLDRPWCYYCEREFEDLKLLISHQKAKHFRCDRCGKRLNTAGGLSVHMNQVHKENLSNVENALPNRQGLDIEIFGMEGIPEDIQNQHKERIRENFFRDQQQRYAATGNPPPGQSGVQGVTKKIKIETAEELKARLAAHRARKLAAANGNPAVPVDGQSPSQITSPFPAPQAGYPYPPASVPGVPGVPAVPGFSPSQAYPPVYPSGPSPPPGAPGAFNLPARPPSNTLPASTLPQRPGYYQNAPGAPATGYPAGASTVDELVSGGARQADVIDQMIRMAEAGVKPAQGAPEQAAAQKKGKKDKARMVYDDQETSPEEKMALLPRYRVPIVA